MTTLKLEWASLLSVTESHIWSISSTLDALQQFFNGWFLYLLNPQATYMCCKCLAHEGFTFCILKLKEKSEFWTYSRELKLSLLILTISFFICTHWISTFWIILLIHAKTHRKRVRHMYLYQFIRFYRALKYTSWFWCPPLRILEIMES